MSEDVGGYHPRHVHFYTSTGRARVKRVTSTNTRARLLAREERKDAQPPRYGDITLFE
jgi:hypothetical protein